MIATAALFMAFFLLFIFAVPVVQNSKNRPWIIVGIQVLAPLALLIFSFWIVLPGLAELSSEAHSEAAKQGQRVVGESYGVTMIAIGILSVLASFNMLVFVGLALSEGRVAPLLTMWPWTRERDIFPLGRRFEDSY